MEHSFLRELVVLQKLRNQPQFLKFLGFRKAEGNEPMCAGFEYMSGGCLREFLASGCIGIGEKPALLKERYNQPRIHPEASLEQLLRIANDVALGMNHLSSIQILHRDLTTANVLLDSNLVGKITGFEFAIDESEDPPLDDFRIEKRSTIRWLAVETLVDGIYSTKSDVWAFGILLWEIITLGGKPYPGLKANAMTKYLELGYRMSRPGACNMKIYNIMLRCWDASPTERPTFEEICELLDDFLQTC